MMMMQRKHASREVSCNISLVRAVVAWWRIERLAPTLPIGSLWTRPQDVFGLQSNAKSD